MRLQCVDADVEVDALVAADSVGSGLWCYTQEGALDAVYQRDLYPNNNSCTALISPSSPFFRFMILVY